MLTGLGTATISETKCLITGSSAWPKKWDENRKNTHDKRPVGLCIPKSAIHERKGAIAEAVCALSGKLVYPNYYEKVLSIRRAPATRSRKRCQPGVSKLVVFDAETYIRSMIGKGQIK